MLTQVLSAAILGVDSTLIRIEVDAQPGLPREQIVGLPNAVVRESKDRVKSAILNGGFEYPPRAYTINLAPAEIRKEGSLFDLPIAYGILKSTHQIDWEFDGLMVGELALNGSITAVRGIISICLMCKTLNISKLMLPHDNLPEAQMVDGIQYIAIKHISELRRIPNASDHIANKNWNLPEFTPGEIRDFSEIRGQYKARRAAEIAAAGWHNLLLIGPPGCGKSMIGQRINSILPPLSDSESVEVLKIESIAGKTWEGRHLLARPFRSPHHTISFGGMVGGGTIPKPGEITRAHLGVLFLDEFGEFPKQVIEILRQPLEDQSLTVSRAAAQVDFPADFLLVAATNPCPCGFHNTGAATPCTCTADQQKRYWRKISGPILDRFDMIVRLAPLDQTDLIHARSPSTAPESSANIQARVVEANRFRIRQGQDQFNGRLRSTHLQRTISHSDEAKAFLSRAIESGKLSARSYFKVLRVAKTIADLAQHEQVTTDHIFEAMQYR